MPRIHPLARSALPEFEPVFQSMLNSIGYVPNSFYTMGRDPGILRAVGGLMDAFWYPDTVSERVRRLVTYAYSRFAHSRYSAAHCACGAEEFGLSLEKIRAVESFETSDLFTDEENDLLRFCKNSAHMPSMTHDDDIAALRRHFSEPQIVFIVGMIAMMAFLNKWNEIIKTDLEPLPLAWANKNLPDLQVGGQ